MKQCQFCKEEIQDEAIKCKHCMSMIGGEGALETMPNELNQWNWAAFLWGPIWAWGHRVTLGWLFFIPYVNIVMFFVFGANANKWAWEAKKYQSVEQYKAKQKKWVRAWLFIWGGFLIITLITPLLTRI